MNYDEDYKGAEGLTPRGQRIGAIIFIAIVAAVVIVLLVLLFGYNEGNSYFCKE